VPLVVLLNGGHRPGECGLLVGHYCFRSFAWKTPKGLPRKFSKAYKEFPNAFVTRHLVYFLQNLEFLFLLNLGQSFSCRFIVPVSIESLGPLSCNALLLSCRPDVSLLLFSLCIVVVFPIWAIRLSQLHSGHSTCQPASNLSHS